MSLNYFDLVFVVDTTGSMGGFISSAKLHMLEMIAELTEKNKHIDMHLGLVEYRDHLPEDDVLTINYPMTGDFEEMKKHINALSLGYGGDIPEAVLDGIEEAILNLLWRPNARKIIILIGDAPPHGYYRGHDHWPEGCPCGKSISSTACLLEEEGITLYSIGLSREVKDSFEQLSCLSGGCHFFSTSSGSIKEIQSLVTEEFKDVAFDQDVLSLFEENCSKEEMAERLHTSMGDVLRSLGRLRSRDFLPDQDKKHVHAGL